MHRTRFLLVVLWPAAVVAQGTPPWQSANPVVSSRSVLGHVPVAERGPGWRTTVVMDYASLVELSEREHASAVVDAELMRLRVHLSRDLGPRLSLELATAVRASYAGFLDKPLNNFHGLIGVNQSARSERPENQFDYRIVLPSLGEVARESGGPALDGLTATLAWHHTPHWQTGFRVGLPLGTGPEGYALAVPGVAMITSARSPAIGRLILEGSTGVGFTPSEGPLAEWQRTTFLSASAGLRFRFWGQQSVYATGFAHTSLYRATTLPALDRADFSLDFGFLLRPGGAGGPELLAGMVEDLYPLGPASDVVFRLGVRW